MIVNHNGNVNFGSTNAASSGLNINNNRIQTTIAGNYKITVNFLLDGPNGKVGTYTVVKL